MKLSETSIRRPVLASMISAALVLFGVIGYTRLSVRELPDIDPPIISVSTTLPGANAQVVETAVTDVLEEELSTIQGLRTLSSSSSEETSQIILEFNLDRPVDVAAQDVRDKVSRVRGRLPVDVLEPVIAKQQADAQPFFWLALSSPNYDLMQLSDVADRLVKARLQSLAGVGSAGVYGERRFAMRVWVQPDQLSARSLTVQDVESAINARNVEIPAGRIESTRREFSVRSLGELKTPREFGELVVTSQGGQVVKLKDVANVELGPEDNRSIFRYNGNPAVAIGVVRQSKANLIEVAPHSPGPPRHPADTAPRREARNRVGWVGVRHALDQRRAPDPPDRGDPRRVDHFRVPAEPAGDRDPRARDPGVDRGDVRHHVFPRLLDQQLHAARPHDRHRHRGGRRDHRAGERLPAPGRAARGARAGRGQRHQRDRLRRDRDDDRAGGGVHAVGLPARLDGAAAERVRDRGGRGRGNFGIRGPDVDADAVRKSAAGAARAWGDLQGVRAGLQCGRGTLREAAPNRAPAPAHRGGRDGRDGGPGVRDLPQPPAGAHSGRRPRVLPGGGIRA